MLIIKETQQKLKKYAIGDTADLQPDLTKNQLLELKEQLENLHKEVGYIYLQGQRKSDCYLWEVNKKLDELNKITQTTYKYNFQFDNLKIEAEKPNETIAYNEPVFIPNETEADIEIMTSELTDEELWEIEKYNIEKERAETKREIDELNETIREENIEWGIITTNTISNNNSITNIYEIKINNLEKIIADLSLRVKELENKQQQTAQIIQVSK